MKLKKLLQNLKLGQQYYINNDNRTVYTCVSIPNTFSELVSFFTPTGVKKSFAINKIHKIVKATNITVGMKFDGVDKLRWDLLPIEFEEVIKVLTKGAKKYADNNWKYIDSAYNRYYAAARRHMEEFRKAIQNGQSRIDEEMGTHVLANAICCLIFLMYMDMNNWPNQKVKPTKTTYTGENAI